MDEETLGQALVQECWPGDSLATASAEDLAMALGLEVLDMVVLDMVVLVMVVATTTSRTPQRRIQQ